VEIVILCAHSSTSLTVKDFFPIGIAILVFIGNVIFQEINRRNNIRDRLSSEVISTCDKMIRYAVEAEHCALTWKYWNKRFLFYPLTVDGNVENNKNAINESVYYHRKLEDAGLKLDLLKSELKKTVRDLQKYWHNEFQVKQIIELMSIVVLKEPRRFDEEINSKYATIQELQKDYNALIETVQKEVVFEGIGFDLIRIQKIIDPQSPTLLLPHELEKELLEKIVLAEKE
jgi:hypothetical protein